LKIFIAGGTNAGCGIKSLTVSNCPQLQEIDLRENSLTNLNFLNNLNPEKLTSLSISDNNLPNQDLTFFSKFKNLEELNLGNPTNYGVTSETNQFYGTLEPLKKLIKLKVLDISNTDVNE